MNTFIRAMKESKIYVEREKNSESKLLLLNNENGKRKIPTLFSHIAHNRNDGDDDDDDEDQVLKTIFSVSLACLLAQPLMAMAQNIESNVVAAF